jgi:hypothetical protein
MRVTGDLRGKKLILQFKTNSALLHNISYAVEIGDQNGGYNVHISHTHSDEGQNTAYSCANGITNPGKASVIAMQNLL